MTTKHRPPALVSQVADELLASPRNPVAPVRTRRAAMAAAESRVRFWAAGGGNVTPELKRKAKAAIASLDSTTRPPSERPDA